MSDLDDKLREVGAKLYNHDFFVTELTPDSPILSHADESVTSAIREIKQAFGEAGYRQLPEGSELEALAAWHSGALLTGQEWFDRLMAEIEKFNYDHRGGIDIDTYHLEDVAKRAAGIQGGASLSTDQGQESPNTSQHSN